MKEGVGRQYIPSRTGGGPMEGFKEILYPIALTDISPRITPYVVTMAKQFFAKVHLLHVLRRFDWFVDTYVSDSPKPDFKRIASDFESEVRLQAQQKLDAFRQKHLKGVDIANVRVVSGTHYKEILNYVESQGIDLIIMGTGTSVQKVIFGSVAEKVSRLANVPVMLIRNS
jgi:nucleotide-binding universal stress UspA family protein